MTDEIQQQIDFLRILAKNTNGVQAVNDAMYVTADTMEKLMAVYEAAGPFAHMFEVTAGTTRTGNLLYGRLRDALDAVQTSQSGDGVTGSTPGFEPGGEGSSPSLPTTAEPRRGVLPMFIDDGETIECDSISGGVDYVDDMPRRLSLVRTLAVGQEIRAEYAYQGRAAGIEPDDGEQPK